MCVLGFLLFHRKYYNQKASWGGKELFDLRLHIAGQHQKKPRQNLKQGATWRRELMLRPWRNAAY